MNRIFKLSAFVAALGLTGGLAEAAPLTLTMNDLTNGGSVTVSDLDGDGIVQFDGTVGGISLVVTTGISKPQAGNDGGTAILRLSNTTLTALLGGTLEILLTDTDFQLAPVGPASFTSQLGGVGDGAIDASQHLDLGNGEFVTSGTDVTSLDHASFTGAGSETLSTIVDYAGELFSITERVLVTLEAGQSASFDLVSTVQAVPEPSSLALGMLAGLGGVVVSLRRRRGTRR